MLAQGGEGVRQLLRLAGESDARAIRSAVRQAVRAAESGVAELIAENVDRMVVPKEQKEC